MKITTAFAVMALPFVISFPGFHSNANQPDPTLGAAWVSFECSDLDLQCDGDAAMTESRCRGYMDAAASKLNDTCCNLGSAKKAKKFKTPNSVDPDNCKETDTQVKFNIKKATHCKGRKCKQVRADQVWLEFLGVKKSSVCRGVPTHHLQTI